MARTKSAPSTQSSATIGFEAKLWLTADKLRNNMDAAEGKNGGFLVKCEIAMEENAKGKKRGVSAFDMIFIRNHPQLEQIAA